MNIGIIVTDHNVKEALSIGVWIHNLQRRNNKICGPKKLPLTNL